LLGLGGGNSRSGKKERSEFHLFVYLLLVAGWDVFWLLPMRNCEL
jgi:hypothetical protein